MKVGKLTFFLLIILFTILAIYLILKSQGLIFDFQTFTIQKSGAIFLKIDPEPDLIKIDDKIINKKNNWPNTLYFLNEGIFISQLKPKKYKIYIEKTNYYPWLKTTEIKENIVNSFNPIILIEKNLKFNEKEIQIDKNLNKIYLINNYIIDKIIKGDEIVYFQDNPSIYISFDKQKKIFYLYDLTTNKLTNFSELFKNLKKQNIYKYSEKEKKEDKEEKILYFYSHPFLNNNLIIQTDFAFYNLSLNNSKLEILFFNESKNKAKIFNKNIFVFNKENELVNYQFITNSKVLEKIILENIENFDFNYFNNTFYFLNQKKELISLNKNKKIEIIEKNVKDFYFSKNYIYLLILTTDNKIKIYDLKQEKNWLIDFNFQNPQKIDFSLINEYFFVLDENKIYLCEIYEGNPNNCYLIINEIKDFKLKENKLIILNNENKILEIEFEKLK